MPLRLGSLVLLSFAVSVLSGLRQGASVVDVLWGFGFAFVTIVARLRRVAARGLRRAVLVLAFTGL